MSGFTFSFSGEDIEDVVMEDTPEENPRKLSVETGTLRRSSSSAFPIAGKPLIEPLSHDLETMLKALPSKIVYSNLIVKLDDGTECSIPRRELWDVRVQLMAEEDDEGLGNLGKDDVKTGVYEGGFKSWESSVDLVKELHVRRTKRNSFSSKFLELGCGTALPSLAALQWHLKDIKSSGAGRLHLGLADYNSTVLQLVTLPNVLLSWAQVESTEPWEAEGELELGDELITKFISSLESSRTSLSFFSGAWCPEFVNLVGKSMDADPSSLLVLGAETIYSPFALKSFADTLSSLMESTPDVEHVALVAAKKVYFGVGGSMEDFCSQVRKKGATVKTIREESDGVRRAVVEVKFPST